MSKQYSLPKRDGQTTPGQTIWEKIKVQKNVTIGALVTFVAIAVGAELLTDSPDGNLRKIPKSGEAATVPTTHALTPEEIEYKQKVDEYYTAFEQAEQTVRRTGKYVVALHEDTAFLICDKTKLYEVVEGDAPERIAREHHVHFVDSSGDRRSANHFAMEYAIQHANPGSTYAEGPSERLKLGEVLVLPEDGSCRPYKDRDQIFDLAGTERVPFPEYPAGS